MYDIFDKLMKERGITPYRVSADAGVPQSTLSGWKASGRTPQRRTLKKISDYFGVSVEYLEGKEDKESPSTVSGEGANEVNQIFNRLSPDNRAKLLELANLYLAAQSNETEKK